VFRIYSVIYGAVLFAVCNLLATATPAQSWRDPDAWGVLAGSIAAVDHKNHTFDVLVRSGAGAAPKQWTQDKSFALSELQLQVRSEPVHLRLSFTEETKVWRVTDARLTAQFIGAVEPGSPVLIELQQGQYWGAKETALPYTRNFTAARVILLQACIEESCGKAKCKGKADCKEKVCDCPKPK